MLPLSSIVKNKNSKFYVFVVITQNDDFDTRKVAIGRQVAIILFDTTYSYFYKHNFVQCIREAVR